jgi:Kef-type K+ transport system membrane component KefB/nucleotide-binding universal stress UspA family protein
VNSLSGIRFRPALLVAVLLAVAMGGPALAAEGGSGPSEVVFLFQLLILMLVGRLLGEAMQRIGQPSVMGMLIAGILLGPSVLGLAWPTLQHAVFPRTPEQKAMLDGISQFGILLLLLLTGMETDLRLVRKVSKAAISISITGVAVPFACGFALGQFLPESLLPSPGHRLLTSLFLGTALSISSIKIVATIVREMGFTRRNLGQVIIASAICEDTIGWVIIAITFSLAEAGTIDPVSVGKSIIGTAVFLTASFTIGQRIVFFLIRWANDNFTSEFPVVTTILVIMAVMALTTHAIGVHSVLGAFVAGVLVGESPILSRHIDEQLRGLILGFFMPVFFGLAGLSTDLTILNNPSLVVMAVGLIAIASIGKFIGAFIGGEIGGLTRREALALACGMNARGSTEVIVATIGLSMGALNQNLFTMIVAMAIITTLAMPPMLRWGLSRVPLRQEEKERIEREEFEAKGFVPQLERLLLAVDDSPNGKFASRLAGLLAGSRGMPITVLSLDFSAPRKPRRSKAEAKVETRKEAKPSKDDKKDTERSEAEAENSAYVVKAAAEQSRNPEKDGSAVEVRAHPHPKPVEDVIAAEAKKGYDLLFIGIGNTVGKQGAFHPDMTRVAVPFDGPLAVAIGSKSELKNPRETFNILVPVAGTEVSRRAAEVAIVIGRSCKARVNALYVRPRTTNGARSVRSRRQEQAILKDIVEVADQLEYEITTAAQSGVAADQAIVAAAKYGRHDLIVMGVSRRAGETLDFGDTAAAVLENVDASILFVAS